MSDIVTIDLTTDLFESQILTEAIRAEGFEVELLNATGEETPAMLPEPCRLLVRAEDVEGVRAILARSTQ